GVRARLAAIAATGTAPEPEEELTVRHEPARRRLTLLPWAIETRLTEALASTGNSIGIWHVIATATVAAGAVGLFAVLVMGMSVPVVVMLVIVAEFAAPAWLIRHLQQRFQRQFVDAFPDALDL